MEKFSLYYVTFKEKYERCKGNNKIHKRMKYAVVIFQM